MAFKDLKGNADVRKGLAEMISSGKIPHALMFFENDGCGALAIIQAFLQRLFCTEVSDNDSCGTCPACNKVAKLIHPDVHYVFPINTSTKVSGTFKDLTSEMFLKWWRELVISNPYFVENQLADALGIEGKNSAIGSTEARRLIDKLSLTSVEGGYRAVVVYLPERMNQEAANRLLKSIEEPPEKTIFLMITHAPEKVLQTISSRCQGIRLLPLTKMEVAQTLEDVFEVSPEEAISAAESAGGSVGVALSVLSETEDATVDKEIFTSLMDALVSRNLYAILEAGEAMAALDSREKQKAFCKFAGECLRKLFMIQQGLSQISGVNPSESDYYNTLALKCKKSFARGAMAQFDKAIMLLDRNVSQKMIFCDLVNHLYFLI